jgi:lantibiotic modifying enzyme
MEPDVALRHAVETERFIDSLRVDSDVDGVEWLQSTSAGATASTSLYYGSAGVIAFEIQLAQATGDTRHLDTAIAAGHALVARVRELPWATVSFTRGWPGYAFVLEALADASGIEEFRDAARMCLDRLMEQAQPRGRGLGWLEPNPFSSLIGEPGEHEIYDISVGAAGAALMLLHAHRTGLHPKALEWAVAVSERLLEVAEDTPDGLRWVMMSDMPFAFTAPGFAHGGAGVGYLMAQVFEATGDSRFFDAAVSAAEYVISREVSVGEGHACLVVHTEELTPPIFYLGKCHGPAGTWRLLTTLARLTDDPRWIDEATALRDGLAALGAPTVRSTGWWNNHSQCCGDAGLGDAALAMWQVTGDDVYRTMAHECADALSAHSTLDEDRRWWDQSEHRLRAEEVEAQIGFMQGAAGIGCFFVHLATVEAAEPVRLWFPDEVF